ncbi:hypothetical protein [Arenimonas alkanexedens]
MHFKVARRGYREITTQMYFDGDPLNAVEYFWEELSPESRASLTVAFAADGGAVPTGRFDVVIKKV